MTGISKAFFHAANALGSAGNAVGKFASNAALISLGAGLYLASGEWIVDLATRTFVLNENINEKSVKRHDNDGNLVTDYGWRVKSAVAGFMLASPLSMLGLATAVSHFDEHSLPALTAAVVAASAGTVIGANMHALGSVLRYGLTNLYNQGSQAIQKEGGEEVQKYAVQRNGEVMQISRNNAPSPV